MHSDMIADHTNQKSYCDGMVEKTEILCCINASLFSYTSHSLVML